VPAGVPRRRLGVRRAGGWGFVAPAGVRRAGGRDLPRHRVCRAGGFAAPAGSPCRWPGSVPRSRVSRHSTGCRRRMAVRSALARVSRHSVGEGRRVLRYSGSAPGARGRPCAACAGPGLCRPRLLLPRRPPPAARRPAPGARPGRPGVRRVDPRVPAPRARMTRAASACGSEVVRIRVDHVRPREPGPAPAVAGAPRQNHGGPGRGDRRRQRWRHRPRELAAAG